MNNDPTPPLPVSIIPPITIRAVTPSDVMMRVAHDGPGYALIALVAVLALKGQASATEMVITGLGALLARSLPTTALRGGAIGALALILLVPWLAACIPASDARATSYSFELEECTRVSTTLQASIECEDKVRARYGRPPHDAGALKPDLVKP